MANTGVARVISNLQRYEQKVRDRLEVNLTRVMADLEAEAKETHPYTDRTGDNSASIQGFVQTVTDREIAGVLTADMPYSANLEKGHEGRYAYLWPVIQRNKEKIMQALKDAKR